jgi:hypothetical protein
MEEEVLPSAGISRAPFCPECQPPVTEALVIQPHWSTQPPEPSKVPFVTRSPVWPPVVVGLLVGVAVTTGVVVLVELGVTAGVAVPVAVAVASAEEVLVGVAVALVTGVPVATGTGVGAAAPSGAAGVWKLEAAVQAMGVPSPWTRGRTRQKYPVLDSRGKSAGTV